MLWTAPPPAHECHERWVLNVAAGSFPPPDGVTNCHAWAFVLLAAVSGCFLRTL
jgi:hypothetical protein